MSLIYGLDGIRQRSYRVWLIYVGSGITGCGESISPLLTQINVIKDKIASCDYQNAFTELSYILSSNSDISEYSEKLGECRKDSVTLTGEDGDSIEGNELGNIVLGKNCTFSCELLNATPENMDTLSDYVENKTPFYVILEEVDGQTKEWSDGGTGTITSNDTHEIIFVGVNNALIAGMSENIIGKGISTVTLTAKDTVSKLSDFRVIIDVPYDLDNVV